MTEQDKLKEKLLVLESDIGEQVVFDILYMRTEKLQSTMVGQHDEYKEIVEELKSRYNKRLQNLKENDNTRTDTTES